MSYHVLPFFNINKIYIILLMSGMFIAQALIAKSAIENEIRRLERELDYVEAQIAGCETDLYDLQFVTQECRIQSGNRLQYELLPKRNQLQNEINRMKNALNDINY